MSNNSNQSSASVGSKGTGKSGQSVPSIGTAKSGQSTVSLGKESDKSKTKSQSVAASNVSVDGEAWNPPHSDPYCCYVDPEHSVKPDYIYGGPFVTSVKPEPFMDLVQPYNYELSGAFRKSFAFRCLSTRLPTILTKVIDNASRKGVDKSVIERISKLKHDLVTNKRYTHFNYIASDTEEWNEWIDASPNKHYFGNEYLFTECYVYRKVWESFQLAKSEHDPFEEIKNQLFTDSVITMCQVADKVTEMLAPKVLTPEEEEEEAAKDEETKLADAKRAMKEEFSLLVKICLWANRLDPAQSAGEPPTLIRIPKPLPPKPAKPKKEPKGKAPPPPPPPPVVEEKPPEEPIKDKFIDPVEMITELKDRHLTDDSGKAFDFLMNRINAIKKAREAAAAAGAAKMKCDCDLIAQKMGYPVCEKRSEDLVEPPKPPVKPEGEEANPAEGGEEPPPPPPPPPPCPAKITVPMTLFFDIVTNNAGYELFAAMCLAHYLLQKQIVERVRFHVKEFPWFVGDSTERDFRYVISACMGTTASLTLPDPPPPDDQPEGEEPPKGRTITSENLQNLGRAFQEHVEKNEFIIMTDEFWTFPHSFKFMKQHAARLYRKLQFAAMIMCLGDLNYRKLLGDVAWQTTLGFNPMINQRGFYPAALLAVRTVKNEAICGLPKNRANKLKEIDPQWMETGEFGVIQCSQKAEPLKIADRPCEDYGDTCRGVTCPENLEI